VSVFILLFFYFVGKKNPQSGKRTMLGKENGKEKSGEVFEDHQHHPGKRAPRG